MPRTTSAAATVLPIVAVLTALGAPRALGASVPAPYHQVLFGATLGA